MNNQRTTFHLGYTLRTMRMDQLYLPIGFWLLFVIIVAMQTTYPEQATNMAVAYLGYLLPLLGGILAANSLLNDTALELLFSTPRPAWRILASRLLIALTIVTVSAVTFQLYAAALHVDLSAYGNLLSRQMLWIIPTLGLTGVGAAVSLLGGNATAGALFVGVIWFFELMLRGWFAVDKVARYFALFMQSTYAEAPYLVWNQLAILGWTLLLGATCYLCLKNSERYI